MLMDHRVYPWSSEYAVLIGVAVIALYLWLSWRRFSKGGGR
jgi:hypothetical protein